MCDPVSKQLRLRRDGHAFVVGALLTLPGASYLAGLHHIDKQHLSTSATVVAVVGFNLIMLILLELPVLSYTIAPDWIPGAVERAKAWVARNGHQAALIALSVIGGALIIKVIVGLAS